MVEVDRAQGIVVVSHKPIVSEKNVDFMPAMMMPFHADPPAALDALRPGMRVAFDLIVAGTKARAIRILDNAAVAEFNLPVPANKLALGAEVPDVAGLIDQQGRPVQFSALRGRVVAVQFIYTRCPLPDVCPRQASQFAYIHRRAPEAVLLTVTLDPTHDTPAVLAEYAARWGTADERWRFVTGSDERIREIGGLFGVVFWPDDGVITHTSATAIIGKDGRLKAVVQGSSHRAEQIVDLVGNQPR